VTLLYLRYLPSGMQLRACVWPSSRSAELHCTLPRTSPDLSMNLKWINQYEFEREGRGSRCELEDPALLTRRTVGATVELGPAAG
jgi:hypothetical protein